MAFSDSFFTIIATAFAVFVITFLGGYLRKKEKLSDEVDVSLMWLVINILLPSLILNSVLQNPALDHLENILLPPIMGYGSVLLGWALGILIYRFASLRSEKDKKSYLLSCAVNNYFQFLGLRLF